MRRSSSTWLFSSIVVLLAAITPTRPVYPKMCVPPILEDGQRLHQVPLPNPASIPMMLRAHELCRRMSQYPDEVRVILAGNSAVYGFPLSVEETAGWLLNQHFLTARIPAHVSNVGALGTYQLKDALIIRAALDYQPDVIVYPVTLSEFVHSGPTPDLAWLFENNQAEAVEFADEHPPGLSEPLQAYRSFVLTQSTFRRYLAAVQRFGVLLRSVLQQHAQTIVRQAFREATAGSREATSTSVGRQTAYDCAQTKRDLAASFRNWQDWNILAYLAQIRGRNGVEILIVNWPVAHQPVQDCYNVRYSNAALQEFNEWLRTQTQALGLRYMDLQTLLEPGDFVDSLHVSPTGQRKIAQRLQPVLDQLVRTLPRSRGARAAADRLPPQ